MFNHNTYFAEARNTIFRKNIFIRSSSIQNKFSSNTDSGTNQVLSWSILLDNNLYFSTSDPSKWFALDGVKYASLVDYRTASGDSTSAATAPGYVDPGRTIESYLASIGQATGMDSFVAELKRHSKFNWNQALTAKTINHYMRQGFCMAGNTGCR